MKYQEVEIRADNRLYCDNCQKYVEVKDSDNGEYCSCIHCGEVLDINWIKSEDISEDLPTIRNNGDFSPSDSVVIGIFLMLLCAGCMWVIFSSETLTGIPLLDVFLFSFVAALGVLGFLVFVMGCFEFLDDKPTNPLSEWP